MVSRRRLMQLGLLGTGAVVVPGAYAALANSAAAAPGGPATAGHHHGAGGTRAALADPAPFQQPMRVPPVRRPALATHDTDFYLMSSREVHTEVIPGLHTPVWSYGDSFVSPTIRARTGRKSAVLYTNKVGMPTVVHLHGGHLPARQDGHPMDIVDNGEQRLYVYPNQQPGATLWYHDHAHHMEAESVYRGLAGFYLLEDTHERALKLPSGKYDIPIMLRDAQFGEDGSLIFEPGDFQNRRTILVNGRQQPFFKVEARKYRFRLVNASNLRAFNLQLGEGEELVQVGNDGGLLPAAHHTGSFELWPGERVEVVVDFSRYPVGTQLVLMNLFGTDDATSAVMRFDVTDGGHDESQVPDELRPVGPLPEATSTRDITMRLDLQLGAMTIDGKVFDPDRVDSRITLGTTEIWQIHNQDTMFSIPHNLHLHLVQFEVLDRDGTPPPPGEAGRKDTVVIQPGQTVRIKATFGDHLGRFVYHCHLLDHSAEGMMAQMEIVR